MMNAREGSSVHFSCCSARARNALDNGRTQMALKTGKAGQVWSLAPRSNCFTSTSHKDNPRDIGNDYEQ
jgi:hypothetical protein